MSDIIEDHEHNIQLWKMRRLIKKLNAARGAGTSMISLIIPPKKSLSHYQSLLTDEYGTASNIKSSVNRLSVLTAITSTQQRLKLYSRVPPNGLVVYCGTILTEEGKERKVNVDFEPFKPINTSAFVCDNKFHTEYLAELLESNSRFGFIVMDGNGCLFGALAGNARDILQKFTVDLPKKHGRGGQSALRFSRLRDEKRHNYVRKVAELAVSHFISNEKVNVKGLILAGNADFKSDLNQSELFDPRLAAKVIEIVDVSYGMENGFNQAIDLASDSLSNVKFVQEKKLIQKYFDEIALDTSKYCFGVDDTLRGLELSAVETLIVWESLDIIRHTLRDSQGREHIVHTSAPLQTANTNINSAKNGNGSALAILNEKDRAKFKDPDTGIDMEPATAPQSLLDWLSDKYTDFGAQLEIVTDKSQEGSQFVKGFGGIGGILRFKVDFGQIADAIYGDDDEFYDE